LVALAVVVLLELLALLEPVVMELGKHYLLELV